jgi:single-strand DNA-binding protein
MRSINKVILIGNLTRDPEMKQTPSGQNIVTFGIATNREWVTRDNSKHSMTEYHDLVAWANLAEICKKYLKKGKLIYVEGYLKTRSWDLPDGMKKFRTEIVVQDMIMLDKRTSEGVDDYIPEEFPNAEVHSEVHTEEIHSEKEAPVKNARHKAAPKAEPEIPPAAAAPAEPAKKPASAGKKSPSPTSVDIDEDLGL